MTTTVPDVVIWSALVGLGTISVYEASLPQQTFGVAALLLSAWAIAFFVWLVGLLALLVSGDRHRILLRWVIPVLVVVSLAVGYLNNVSDKARFWMSRGALNAAGDAVLRDEPVRGRVGYYGVHFGERVGHAVELTVAGDSFLGGWVLARDEASHPGCERLDRRWQLCPVGGD